MHLCVRTQIMVVRVVVLSSTYVICIMRPLVGIMIVLFGTGAEWAQ